MDTYDAFGFVSKRLTDHKWLFVATAQGSIAVVNDRTLAVSTLDASLPPLTQLAIRPAGNH
jgi:hypothetical protein